MASFLMLHTLSNTVYAELIDTRSLEKQAIDKGIAQTALWHTLLHLKNAQPINPTSVYLSTPFDPETELVNTIRLSQTDPEQACAYPARKRFIEDQLSLKPGSLSSVVCTDYEEFLSFVPNDEYVLVYASENVNSASSMMGHIMLRLDGTNNNGTFVQHGITYFTELDSLNAAKILYDSLVTGKEGIFQVAPYAPVQAHYRNKEQRNIWEYTLTLSDKERALIRDAIWELGQHTPSYFFHEYNCATVTQLLLSIARPESINNMASWLTPIDIVKFSNHANLVSHTRVVPSERWKTNALIEQLPSARVTSLAEVLQNGQVDSIALFNNATGFTEFELLKSINNLWYSQSKLSQQQHNANQAALAQFDDKFAGYQLDVSEYKSPLDAQDESLIAIGMGQIEGSDAILFRYFPVASDITDNQGHIFGENQLLLADTQIRIDLNRSKIHLDNLSLYRMKSRVPFSTVTGGFSSGLHVGLTRFFDSNLNSTLVANVEGTFGLSHEPTSDIGVFVEMAVGAVANFKRSEVYLEPRLGAHLYAVYNTKINASIGWAVNKLAHSPIASYRLTSRTTTSKNGAIVFDVNTQQTNDSTLTNVSLLYHHRF